MPVIVPPKGIRDLRSLFATYGTLRKEIGHTKNRIHSLLKENLYPFTREYVFGKNTRKEIRVISENKVLSFQINLLLDTLEKLEDTFDRLVIKIKKTDSVFMSQIEILTIMSGISVITALAVISGVFDIMRFKNSKHFASYLRSASRVESSNDKTIIKSTTKAGRKHSIDHLSQSLNHFRDNNRTLFNWYERAKVYKRRVF